MLLRAGAALYDCILVEMKPGKHGGLHDSTDRGRGDVSTSAKFVLDGKHLAIYHMDAESARPK